MAIQVYFLLLVYIYSSSAAPLENVRVRLPREKGCYYLNSHYENGDRISTNEPCLNCTCYDNMLMCYLRICPFVKPMGEECIEERHEGDCCPKIWCPEVITNKCDDPNHDKEHDHPGCYLNSKYYPDGARLPRDPHKPCEVCYCIRNSTHCVVQECALHVQGCSPVYTEGHCCPCRYNCTYEETTTPSKGAILEESQDFAEGCVTKSGIHVSDGEAINSTDPCEHCYCMRNEVVCAVQKCQVPDASCKPLLPKPGHCCPDKYECSLSSEQPVILDLKETVKEISMTTLIPTEISTEGIKRLTPSISVKSEKLASRIKGIKGKVSTSTHRPKEYVTTASSMSATLSSASGSEIESLRLETTTQKRLEYSTEILTTEADTVLSKLESVSAAKVSETLPPSLALEFDGSALESAPASSISNSLPASSISDSLPASSILESLPASSISDSLPASSVPDSLPASSISDSLPVSSISDSSLASSISDSSLESSTSNSLLTSLAAHSSSEASTLHSLPERSTLDSSLGSSTLDSSLESSTLDSSLERSTLDSSLGSSTLDSSLESSTLDSSLERSTLDSSLESSASDSSLISSKSHSSSESTTLHTSPESSTLHSSPESTTLHTSPESSTLHSSPESSTLVSSTESSTLLSSPESSTLHYSPESSTLHSSPESSTLHSSSDSSTLHSSSDSSTLHSSPESSTLHSSPESSTLHSSPESSTLHSSPESSTLHFSPESSTLHSSPESSTLHSSPESSTLHFSPESSTLHSSPESSTLHSSPESSTLHSSPESSTLHSSPESSTPESSPEGSTLEYSPDTSDSSLASSTLESLPGTSDLSIGSSDSSPDTLDFSIDTSDSLPNASDSLPDTLGFSIDTLDSSPDKLDFLIHASNSLASSTSDSSATGSTSDSSATSSTSDSSFASSTATASPSRYTTEYDTPSSISYSHPTHSIIESELTSSTSAISPEISTLKSTVSNLETESVEISSTLSSQLSHEAASIDSFWSQEHTTSSDASSWEEETKTFSPTVLLEVPVDGFKRIHILQPDSLSVHEVEASNMKKEFSHSQNFPKEYESKILTSNPDVKSQESADIVKEGERDAVQTPPKRVFSNISVSGTPISLSSIKSPQKNIKTRAKFPSIKTKKTSAIPETKIASKSQASDSQIPKGTFPVGVKGSTYTTHEVEISEIGETLTLSPAEVNEHSSSEDGLTHATFAFEPLQTQTTKTYVENSHEITEHTQSSVASESLSTKNRINNKINTKTFGLKPAFVNIKETLLESESALTDDHFQEPDKNPNDTTRVAKPSIEVFFPTEKLVLESSTQTVETKSVTYDISHIENENKTTPPTAYTETLSESYQSDSEFKKDFSVSTVEISPSVFVELEKKTVDQLSLFTTKGVHAAPDSESHTAEPNAESLDFFQTEKEKFESLDPNLVTSTSITKQTETDSSSNYFETSSSINHQTYETKSEDAAASYTTAPGIDIATAVSSEKENDAKKTFPPINNEELIVKSITTSPFDVEKHESNAIPSTTGKGDSIEQDHLGITEVTKLINLEETEQSGPIDLKLIPLPNDQEEISSPSIESTEKHKESSQIKNKIPSSVFTDEKGKESIALVLDSDNMEEFKTTIGQEDFHTTSQLNDIKTNETKSEDRNDFKESQSIEIVSDPTKTISESSSLSGLDVNRLSEETYPIDKLTELGTKEATYVSDTTITESTNVYSSPFTADFEKSVSQRESLKSTLSEEQTEVETTMDEINYSPSTASFTTIETPLVDTELASQDDIKTTIEIDTLKADLHNIKSITSETEIHKQSTSSIDLTPDFSIYTTTEIPEGSTMPSTTEFFQESTKSKSEIHYEQTNTVPREKLDEIIRDLKLETTHSIIKIPAVETVSSIAILKESTNEDSTELEKEISSQLSTKILSTTEFSQLTDGITKPPTAEFAIVKNIFEGPVSNVIQVTSSKSDIKTTSEKFSETTSEKFSETTSEKFSETTTEVFKESTSQINNISTSDATIKPTSDSRVPSSVTNEGFTNEDTTKISDIVQASTDVNAKEIIKELASDGTILLSSEVLEPLTPFKKFEKPDEIISEINDGSSYLTDSDTIQDSVTTKTTQEDNKSNLSEDTTLPSIMSSESVSVHFSESEAKLTTTTFDKIPDSELSKTQSFLLDKSVLISKDPYVVSVYTGDDSKGATASYLTSTKHSVIDVNKLPEDLNELSRDTSTIHSDLRINISRDSYIIPDEEIRILTTKPDSYVSYEPDQIEIKTIKEEESTKEISSTTLDPLFSLKKLSAISQQPLLTEKLATETEFVSTLVERSTSTVEFSSFDSSSVTSTVFSSTDDSTENLRTIITDANSNIVVTEASVVESIDLKKQSVSLLSETKNLTQEENEKSSHIKDSSELQETLNPSSFVPVTALTDTTLANASSAVTTDSRSETLMTTDYPYETTNSQNSIFTTLKDYVTETISDIFQTNEHMTSTESTVLLTNSDELTSLKVGTHYDVNKFSMNTVKENPSTQYTQDYPNTDASTLGTLQLHNNSLHVASNLSSTEEKDDLVGIDTMLLENIPNTSPSAIETLDIGTTEPVQKSFSIEALIKDSIMDVTTHESFITEEKGTSQTLLAHTTTYLDESDAATLHPQNDSVGSQLFQEQTQKWQFEVASTHSNDASSNEEIFTATDEASTIPTTEAQAPPRPTLNDTLNEISYAKITSNATLVSIVLMDQNKSKPTLHESDINESDEMLSPPLTVGPAFFYNVTQMDFPIASSTYQADFTESEKSSSEIESNELDELSLKVADKKGGTTTGSIIVTSTQSSSEEQNEMTTFLETSKSESYETTPSIQEEDSTMTFIPFSITPGEEKIQNLKGSLLKSSTAFADFVTTISTADESSTVTERSKLTSADLSTDSPATETTVFKETTSTPPTSKSVADCFFNGQIYQSSEQIPRKDACEFCFCFRGDIICLQQTCPPPISGCYATSINGFCCPRFQCPVPEKRLNSTTTTTTPTPEMNSVSQAAAIGCEIGGQVYGVGELVRPASGLCMQCRCEHGGMMKCDPQDCQEPLIMQLNKEFFTTTNPFNIS